MTPNATGWDELHLAENPAVELLQSLGYTYVPPEDLERRTRELQGAHPHRPPQPGPQAAEPLALRDQPHQGSVREVTHVRAASLAEANQALYTSLTYGIALEQDRGDGRQEPHGPVPRLRQPGSQRVDCHPAVQGPRVEEARHPRRRRLR